MPIANDTTLPSQQAAARAPVPSEDAKARFASALASAVKGAPKDGKSAGPRGLSEDRTSGDQVSEGEASEGRASERGETRGSGAAQGALRDARARLARLLSTKEGQARLAMALDGKSEATRTAAEQASLRRLLAALRQGALPSPRVVTAKSLGSAEGQGTPEQAANALPAGVKGAFVPGETGKPGTILLSDKLSAAERAETLLEEQGEALAALAKRQGVKLAPGDVGARLARAARGEAVSPEATPGLYRAKASDKGRVRLDGKTVEAKFASPTTRVTTTDITPEGTPEKDKEKVKVNINYKDLGVDNKGNKIDGMTVALYARVAGSNDVYRRVAMIDTYNSPNTGGLQLDGPNVIIKAPKGRQLEYVGALQHWADTLSPQEVKPDRNLIRPIKMNPNAAGGRSGTFQWRDWLSGESDKHAKPISGPLRNAFQITEAKRAEAPAKNPIATVPKPVEPKDPTGKSPHEKDLDKVQNEPKPTPPYRQNAQPGVIEGHVVSIDPSGNKKPGAGLRVGIDRDGDGRIDPGEITVTTAKDGSYRFTNVDPGIYGIVVDKTSTATVRLASTRSNSDAPEIRTPDGKLVDGKGTTVFVIDSPADLNHPFAKGADIKATGEPFDPNYDPRRGFSHYFHGTAVASLIAKQAGAKGSGAGSAPGAKVLAYGHQSRADELVYGLQAVIDYAKKNPGTPVIVNLSQHLHFTADAPASVRRRFDRAFKRLDKELANLGVTVVVAGGNDNDPRKADNLLIKNMPNAIVVTSSDEKGNILDLVQFDPTFDTVAVKGRTQNIAVAGRNDYADLPSDTSFAAPIVTGAIAKMQQYAVAKYGRRLAPKEAKLLVHQSGLLRTNKAVDSLRKSGSFREFSLENLKESVDNYLGNEGAKAVRVTPGATTKTDFEIKEEL